MDLAPIYAIVGFVLFVAVFITSLILLAWFRSRPQIASKLEALQSAWIAFKDGLWSWATAWLYRRDWTKRRAKAILRTIGYIIRVLILIGVLILVVNYRYQVWAFLLAFPLLWVDSLEAFASAVGLNGRDLATIASADLIVVIATACLNFIVIRAIRKERPHPAEFASIFQLQTRYSGAYMGKGRIISPQGF